jgi:putative MATE family efflux protein
LGWNEAFVQGRFTIDDAKPIWRTLIVFLIPLMLSNVLQAASATFNSIYLGQLLGVKALAAVSVFFPIQFFLVSFFIGISNGSTVLIGQAYGAKDPERIRAIAGTTLSVAVLLGMFVAVVGGVFTEPVLRIIGTPADILVLAIAYAKLTFFALPVFFVYLGYTTFMRGVGDSQTPFYFLIVSTLLGLVLTPAFIRGWLGLPEFGVASAAVASTLSTIVGLAGILVVLHRRNDALAFNAAMLRALRIEPSLLKAIIKIGLPTGLQFVMISLAEIAVITFVNRFGSTATAAYGAVNQIVSYVQFPALSVGIAASIFGAQSIGAQRYDRLTRIVRSGVTLNYVITGSLFIIAYIFDHALLSAFVKDENTLEIAQGLLFLTLWSYAIFGNTTVLSGVMRSSGTVIWPTLISIFSIWGVEVPVAYVLSQKTSLGLRGVWLAYPVAFLVALTLQTSYYKLVWRKRKLTPIAT